MISTRLAGGFYDISTRHGTLEIEREEGRKGERVGDG